MKKRMVALALATVMVLAAFVPLMGMVNADNDQGIGAGDKYSVYDLPTTPGRIEVEVKWSGQEWTNWNAAKQCHYGIEMWGISGPNMDPTYSFCSELGSPSIDEKGYEVDPAARGITKEKELQLIAALDYVNDVYGFTWEFPINYYKANGEPVYFDVREVQYFGYALAQLAIWSIIEDLEGIRGMADNYWWDIFGEALDDVLANSVTVYKDKMAAEEPGVGYVSGIKYLVGDYRPDYQRQLFPLFDVFGPKTKTGDGVLIIGKEMGKKASYGSVTGGYSSEAVPNAKGKYDHATYVHNLDTKLGTKGNWFQYNTWDASAVGTFDLVTGDKLKKVGEYDIVSNGDGTFTVTLRPNDALVPSGAKISISNEITGAKNKNDFAKLKNVAANPIWTSAPGQQQFAFSGYTYTFSAPWVDLNKPVFVYIHLSLDGYEETAGAGIGAMFDVKVTGPSFPNGKVFQVPMNGFIKLDNLIPGLYTVEEIESAWEATYYVNGGKGTTEPVTVNVSSKGVTVNMTNKPREIPDPKGKVLVLKSVQEHEGYFPGEGYEFGLFAGVGPNGEGVGQIGDTVITGADGIAVFGPSVNIVAGTTYYVFEILNDGIHKYGAQGSYIPVVAVDENDVVDVGDIDVFVNDLILGAFSIYMEYQLFQEYKYSYSGGTVTGQDRDNPGQIIPGWNHFEAAYGVDVDKILAGEDYRANLVVGNKADVVGYYVVSATEGNGLKVELFFIGGAQVGDNTAVMMVFGNKNIKVSHNDVSSSNSNNGSGLYYKKGTNVMYIPAEDVTKLNVSGVGQYLMIHTDISNQSGSYYEDISASYNDGFWFDEEDYDHCEVCSGFFLLCDGTLCDYKLFDNMLPGLYEVIPPTMAGWTFTCTQGDIGEEHWFEVVAGACYDIVVCATCTLPAK